MPIVPKDYTAQEKLVAEVLDALGIGYAQQVEFNQYTVDFYLPDNSIVIEADGKWGHLKKADAKRDAELKMCNSQEILDVFHIKGITKSEIMKEIQEFFSWDREEPKA